MEFDALGWFRSPHPENYINIKWQDGPIKEVGGENGCQVEDVIEVCIKRISYLNSQFPCKENLWTLSSFQTALGYLNQRTADREKRGVEGTNQT